jgi:hypothetical protein
MVMTENPDYKIHHIHKGMDVNAATPEYSPDQEAAHKTFVIYGKLDFPSLDLKECNWERRGAMTPPQKMFLETTPGYKTYKENMFFKGPQGHAIMHINYRTDIHKLKINLNTYGKDTPETMKIIKSMFEMGLGCICFDADDLPEGLENRIKTMKRTKHVKPIEN